MYVRIYVYTLCSKTVELPTSFLCVSDISLSDLIFISLYYKLLAHCFLYHVLILLYGMPELRHSDAEGSQCVCALVFVRHICCCICNHLCCNSVFCLVTKSVVTAIKLVT